MFPFFDISTKPQSNRFTFAFGITPVSCISVTDVIFILGNKFSKFTLLKRERGEEGD